MKNVLSIALAFVGLLVGAGFATGKEVIQYFLSFGPIGIIGAVVSGLIMTAAGAVILQLGSYFLADEHNMVFRKVSHPIVSRFLDFSVTITLFAVGFVMFAGAGSNLEQQFGLPAWSGALLMTIIVMLVGMLDVDKVSAVIGLMTPMIIIAVCAAFIYTMFNLPDFSDATFSTLSSAAQEQDSPVSPWWLSALNYNGLALLLGVSMSLVIGGNHVSPKVAGLGGLVGGAVYMALMLIAAVTLYLNIDTIGDASVPMLALLNRIHPAVGIIMALIIFGMIFNTAIGMFYALGKRLTATRPQQFLPVFWGTCLVGYGVSFVGFETLMAYVYPVIGYIGVVMMVVLLAWWGKSRVRIGKESQRRERIHELTSNREDPDTAFTRRDAEELQRHVEESNIDNQHIVDTIEEAVAEEVEEPR